MGVQSIICLPIVKEILNTVAFQFIQDSSWCEHVVDIGLYLSGEYFLFFSAPISKARETAGCVATGKLLGVVSKSPTSLQLLK